MGNTNFDYAEYRRFIAGKSDTGAAGDGFKLTRWPDMLKVHQIAALEFACHKARGANFLDTGLGKSAIELSFAQACVEEANKPALILTPLAVTRQMVAEGEKFGIGAKIIRAQSEVTGPGV